MDTPKNKRILWLLNHTTLRNSEVPMLIRMGFEIYTPKIFPSDDANRSASISYAYDDTLSISPSLLKQLNEFDFYSKSWSKSFASKINEHFGIVIAAIFPKMVNAICESFNGFIFLRAFGLTGDQTYAELFLKHYSKQAYERIKSGDGIWLATSIATVIDNEPQWLQRNSIYLPVGLPQNLYHHQSQWRGEQDGILFICPRINSSPYCNRVYRQFKSLLGDLPHVIGGAQPEAVKNDPRVRGFLEQSEYADLFKSLKVMYYHSQEERHLHYHPIEAIVYGMPLVFMSGGVLEFFAKTKLPGSCDTPEEARIKIQRVLKGEEGFIKEIIASQHVLLKEFDSHFVENSWKENFLNLIDSSHKEYQSAKPQSEATKIKHIGFWMHETSPHGFTGEGISRLQAMIVKGAQEHPDLKVHIAAVSWVKKAIIDYMGDLGIDTRRLSFVLVDEKDPLIFQIYNWWNTRRPRVKHRQFPFTKLRRCLKYFYGELGARLITMRMKMGLYSVLLLTIFALPIAMILGIALLVVRLLKEILKRLIYLLKIGRFTSYIAVKVDNTKAFLLSLAPRVYRYMTDAEMTLLARKAGNDKKFAAWFFAYPNNKYLSYFDSPKIVAVPDFVFLDFPTEYSKELNGLKDLSSNIKQTIRNADAVITFSDYVRQNHIIKPNLQPEENITVIRHAPIETRALISPRSGVDDTELRLLARRVIKNYLQKRPQDLNDGDSLYLQSLALGEIDYLFVSSQTRPHKNHLNLLKAYRFLLREQYINTKIVFTGRLSPEMQDYITQEHLNLDVISMHYMPPKVHAAFYACAKLTVVPTLFEGGFPFVFSESLSVNTPVIMSDIPAVREVFSESERKLIGFDPYNVYEMAEKISWAFENRFFLLSAETAIYEQMKKRTWKDVAEEYLEVISSANKYKE